MAFSMLSTTCKNGWRSTDSSMMCRRFVKHQHCRRHYYSHHHHLSSSSLLFSSSSSLSGKKPTTFHSFANKNRILFLRRAAFASSNNDSYYCENNENNTNKNDYTKQSSSITKAATAAAITREEQTMSHHALDMVKAAIHAVDPVVSIQSKVKATKEGLVVVDATTTTTTTTTTTKGSLLYSCQNYNHVILVAFGKASSAMAITTLKLVKEAMPNAKLSGIVVVKDDHATKEEMELLEKNAITVMTASHPIPDERSVAAAERIMDLISSSSSSSSSSSGSDNNNDTLIISCISGGGSALVCQPRPPLTLESMAETYRVLLGCGMSIDEINVLRKKLELGVKGGRLAAAAYPFPVLSLILSDVIGDPLDLIASGPTVPDSSSWNDASQLLKQYGLMFTKSSSSTTSTTTGQQPDKEEDTKSSTTIATTTSSIPSNEVDSGGGEQHAVAVLPDEALEIIQKGLDGTLEDTPKADHPMFTTAFASIPTNTNNDNRDVAAAAAAAARRQLPRLCETVLVGNNELAVMAAAQKAQDLGYNTVVLGTTIEGEAKHVAGVYTAMALQLHRQQRQQKNRLRFAIAKLPAAIIAGGETTVTLSTSGSSNGKGGRNQELALAAGLQLQRLGLRNVVLASVGTDGTDGPTDAAGALVDGGTIQRVEAANHGMLLGEAALHGHDAYTFFSSMNNKAETTRTTTATATTAATSNDDGSDSTTTIISPLVMTGPTGTNVADVCVMLVV